MSESRDPIGTTLASHLNMRLTRLAKERDIQMEKLLDKSVELLLEYMEDHENLNDHIKLNNVEAINKNREIILQSRQLLKDK
ncbi:hypothetical protein ACIQXU_11635 [Peribacillus sp. NPDC097284]|uniref:hypothetical protein n=1 Tax=Peribacillus sp. NPDC097284 TaxID=3364401 RepID=UPI0038247E81